MHTTLRGSDREEEDGAGPCPFAGAFSILFVASALMPRRAGLGGIEPFSAKPLMLADYGHKSFVCEALYAGFHSGTISE